MLNSENCPEYRATFSLVRRERGGMKENGRHIFPYFYQQPYTKFIVPLKYFVGFVAVVPANNTSCIVSMY